MGAQLSARRLGLVSLNENKQPQCRFPTTRAARIASPETSDFELATVCIAGQQSLLDRVLASKLECPGYPRGIRHLHQEGRYLEPR